MTTLTLSVIRFNGAPPASPLSATFDELGGLIGRADTNQLVLPDPDRSISRVHAQVVFRNAGYAIVDRGSNPITVNGRAAGNDREVPLRQGDVVQIGGYELSASLGPAALGSATTNDPFADLLGPTSAPAAARSGGLVDPLAAFSSAAPAPPPIPQTQPGVRAIPDDWDPFAADAPAQAGGSAPRPGGGGALGLDLGAAAPAALIPDLNTGAAKADSLDALFGLGPSSGDPFANSALAQPAAQPNMAGHADPLKALGSAPLASAASRPDTVSELNSPFLAPPTRAATPAPVPLPAAPAAAARPGVVLSWDEGGDGAHTIIKPAAPRSAVPPVPAAPAASLPVDDPLAAFGAPPAAATIPDDPLADFGTASTPIAPPAAALASPAAAPAARLPDSFDFAAPAAPVTPVAPVSPAAPLPSMAPAQPAPLAAAAAPPVHATANASADVQALLAAFRQGLNLPELKLDALTPGLMLLVGQLLREAAGGTVDLLVARAALKREIRAESTMIVARENNPLKFSPSAEAALQHLLSPPTRGFMAAGPAMKDAYADLRAHQFGLVAGMRAALEGVLARFEPAELEGMLAEGSLLSNLLPGSRKARLWELFVEHFGQIRDEASDDFHKLFGEAFLQAYEQKLDQLHEGKA